MARKKRNITGLRGQPKLTPSHVKSADVPPISNSDLPQSSDADPDPDEEEWCPNLQFDSGKPKWDALDTEDDIDSEDEQDFLDSKEEQRPGVNIRRYRNNSLYIALMRVAILAGDDLRDEDWVPKKVRKKLRKEKTARPSRPKECVKGPDVGSKSSRTRRRYRDLLKDQRTLDSHGFMREKKHREEKGSEVESDQGIPVKQESPTPSIVFEELGNDSENIMDVDDVPIRMESVTPPPLYFDNEIQSHSLRLSPQVQIRQESVTPPPLNFGDEVPSTSH